MLDYRMETFKVVCYTMNYRKAAEILNMTQPAVSQHIKYLENYFDCKLFHYNGRELTKTKEATIIEGYLISAIQNERLLFQKINQDKEKEIHIGLTKTIGSYTFQNDLIKLINDSNYKVKVTIDNTLNLFNLMNQNEIDFLIIEGNFSKENYDYMTYKSKRYSGICAKDHLFADQVVPIETLFNEHLILREEGSGTRKIFESLLQKDSFSLDSFKKISVINQFDLILGVVARGDAITFGYEDLLNQDKRLTTFMIENEHINHEFNFVYLKHTGIQEILDELKEKGYFN